MSQADQTESRSRAARTDGEAHAPPGRVRVSLVTTHKLSLSWSVFAVVAVRRDDKKLIIADRSAKDACAHS